KYSPPGATVDVAVANGEVSVRDRGPGIAAEDAPRVFDRFWRSNDARHLPGSGLGLSIVKDVAESHGGSVTFERPIDGGGGARFPKTRYPGTSTCSRPRALSRRGPRASARNSSQRLSATTSATSTRRTSISGQFATPCGVRPHPRSIRPRRRYAARRVSPETR